MSFLLKLAICSILFYDAFAKGLSKRAIDTSLNGSYYWQLMLDIDNSNNSGTFEREVLQSISVFTSYTSLKDDVVTSEGSSSTGISLGASLFNIIGIQVSADVDAQIKSSYQNIVQDQVENTVEIIKNDSYKVGPNSRLILYRLVYNGPGVQYQTDTISSTPHPRPKVLVDVSVNQVLFLKGIDVVFTDDAASQPENSIPTPNEPNGDINKGFKGKFVWLVPVWTNHWHDAITGIEIVIQNNANENYEDVTKGAGGPFRYIKLLKRYPNNDYRISDIGLWRSSTSGHGVTGYDYKTIDINSGRGGDWLYIVWNTRSIF